jgi:hypothetical protein
LNTKLERDDVFQPTTIERKNLLQDSNVSEVRKVNFTTSKNLQVKNRILLHKNVHQYT